MLNAMLICGIGKYSQLFFAFSRKQKSGTSLFFRSYFIFAGLASFYLLNMYLQMGPDRTWFYTSSGILSYQAGYVLSAIGLIIKTWGV